MLYESYIHPITILSTLPSAGVGAVLALLLFNTEFSIIALIGVILLIGIVKKNAIMMIDFALEAERAQSWPRARRSIEACLLRFRPIMMTTMAAMLGALPLASSIGEGAEMRQPLGISIVGGLLVSQVLTLYTTPVVYLYLDRFRLAARRRWRQAFPGLSATPGAGGMSATLVQAASHRSQRRRLHVWRCVLLLRYAVRLHGRAGLSHAPTRRCPSPTRNCRAGTVAQPQDAADRGPGGRSTTIRNSTGWSARWRSPTRP